MTSIPTGRYRHCKGNEYTVLGVTRHSESLEELVLYRQEYGDHGLWVRPKEMFSETVTVDGEDVPRFQYLGTEPAKQTDAGNLFSNIPPSLPQELIQTLLTKPNVRIERIVSHGHSSSSTRRCHFPSMYSTSWRRLFWLLVMVSLIQTSNSYLTIQRWQQSWPVM